MGKLLRDESGIAMGLAVILIVVIGVMGAGLLVFVRNDLEAVIQVNQGQRAFETADAGVQAAEQRLNSGQGIDGTQWSASAPNNAAACKNLGPDGNTKGVCLTGLYNTSAGNSANVQIEESGNKFTVTSTGKYGAAKRRVKAVFTEEPREKEDGVPPELQDFHTNGNFVVRGQSTLTDSMAYVQGDTDIASTLNLENSALYSEGDFSVNPTLNLDNSSVFTKGNFSANRGYNEVGIEGEDPFGYWVNPPYNSSARETSEPGIGAEGEIIQGRGARPMPGYDGPGPQQHYDGTTNPAFGDGITYPFDIEAVSGRQPNIEELRKVAKSQSNFEGEEDNYIEVDSSEDTVGLGNNGYGSGLAFPWPEDATIGTVVFVSFKEGADNKVEWREFGNCNETPREGVVVVENAELDWAGASSFKGALITVDGPTQAGTIDVNGNFCTSGPVYADGTIDIGGSGANTSSLESEEFEQLPPGIPGTGSGKVRLQSWRELYQ